MTEQPNEPIAHIEVLDEPSPMLSVRCQTCGKGWLGAATFADLRAIRLLFDTHAQSHLSITFNNNTGASYDWPPK